MSSPLDDFDRFLEETRDIILDHGHVTHYSDDRNREYRDLPRAWTTGRTLWQRPELMIVGPFTEQQMQTYLNEAVDLDSHTPLETLRSFELDGRGFISVPADSTRFVIAIGVFQHIQALQLLWLREDGHPGEQPTFPPTNMPPQFSG